MFYGILTRAGLTFEFAYRTFTWSNEAPGEAQVDVVILGVVAGEPASRTIFDHDPSTGKVVAKAATRINSYLVDSGILALGNRREPVSAPARIVTGSMPNDGGHLVLSSAEANELRRVDPKGAKLLRRFVSADEFLDAKERWCLWLVGASAADIKASPQVVQRVVDVRLQREASTRPATQKLASTPTLFGEIRQPVSRYILIPRHSLESRRVIPMDILGPEWIVGDSCVWVESDDLFVFGVLSSAMHMAWVRTVCGRLQSRFRYSNEVVYNNFPWPESPEKSLVSAVRKAAQGVLDARTPKGTALSELYDPLLIPPNLSKAHDVLDRAVERCYRSKKFGTDAERIEFLFKLYESQVVPLAKVKRRVKRASTGKASAVTQ